jgi:transcriptional regulator of acetoin/glycerol metabolism
MVARVGDSQPLRPEIAQSWERSRLSGVRRDSPQHPPTDPVDQSVALVRAALPVVDRLAVELDGSNAAVILADHNARVAKLHSTHRFFDCAFPDLGGWPGAQFGEEYIGTNAVGTPLEVRRSIMIRGREHFSDLYAGLSCYGHPIINPVTRRLQGVLNVSVRVGDEHPLFAPLIARVVHDIEERLRDQAPRADQHLTTAFRLATRSKRHAVVALSRDLHVASLAAIDMLQAPDYASLRAVAEGLRGTSTTPTQLVLASGQPVTLTVRQVEGSDGVLIELATQGVDIRRTSDMPLGWPLLVVGEVGTGRTTVAYHATGDSAISIDVADTFPADEPQCAQRISRLLQDDGPAAVLENIQLLSERLTMILARSLRTTRRRVVMTSTPGVHLSAEHASLTSACGERRDLLPLRLRRHEVPTLAQEMLAAATGAQARLTSATLRTLSAQPWPGNLSELRRVIDRLASIRSVGDITPNDLPPSHRHAGSPATVFEQAEREVVITAINAAGGNKRLAAHSLGISRSTLYNKLRALNID